MVNLSKMRHSRASMQNNIIDRRVIVCSKNIIMLDFFFFPSQLLESSSWLLSWFQNLFLGNKSWLYYLIPTTESWPKVLQIGKLVNKIVNADIAVSETPWLQFWKNLPAPVLKTSSVRFSRRLSLLFCQQSLHKERSTGYGLNFQAHTLGMCILLM